MEFSVKALGAAAAELAEKIKAPAHTTEVLPGRLGRLSPTDRQILRTVLGHHSDSLDESARRVVVRAVDIDPTEPITAKTLMRLCEMLAVATDDLRIAWVVDQLAPVQTVGPAAALRQLRPRFVSVQVPTAEAVIDEIRVLGMKVWDHNLVAVCDGLSTIAQMVDADTVSTMAEALYTRRYNTVAVKRAAHSVGLELTGLQMIEIRVEVLRQRRQAQIYHPLTDDALERIEDSLAGAKPSYRDVALACQKLGLRIGQEDRRRAARILRERLDTKRLQITSHTADLLALIAKRVTGVKRNLIVDRLLLLGMKQMIANGQARLDPNLDKPLVRRMIKAQFSMLAPTTPAADAFVRRSKRKKAPVAVNDQG